MLKEDWVFPLPLLWLALVMAIPSEVYCITKKGRKESSIALILVLLISGVGTIAASTYFTSVSFNPGDRVNFGPWYLPVSIGILSTLCILFSLGIRKEIKEKHFKIITIRIPVFFFALYIAVTTMLIPYRIDHQLKESGQNKTVERNSEHLRFSPRF